MFAVPVSAQTVPYTAPSSSWWTQFESDIQTWLNSYLPAHPSTGATSAPSAAPSSAPSTGPTTTPMNGVVYYNIRQYPGYTYGYCYATIPTSLVGVGIFTRVPSNSCTVVISATPTPTPTNAPTTAPTTAPSASAAPTTTPAPGSVVLSPVTLSLTVGAGSGTSTASETNYSGSFTAVSSNTNIATVSVSGATITVVPVAAGSATVTVTGATGQTATIAVTIAAAATPAPTTAPTTTPTPYISVSANNAVTSPVAITPIGTADWILAGPQGATNFEHFLNALQFSTSSVPAFYNGATPAPVPHVAATALPTFTYTNGTTVASGSSATAQYVEGLNADLSFAAPADPQPRIAFVYLGADCATAFIQAQLSDNSAAYQRVNVITDTTGHTDHVVTVRYAARTTTLMNLTVGVVADNTNSGACVPKIEADALPAVDLQAAALQVVATPSPSPSPSSAPTPPVAYSSPPATWVNTSPPTNYALTGAKTPAGVGDPEAGSAPFGRMILLSNGNIGYWVYQFLTGSPLGPNGVQGGYKDSGINYATQVTANGTAPPCAQNQSCPSPSPT